MTRSTVVAVCAVVLVTSATGLPLSAQEPETVKAPPCSSAEHRQFDFWVGEWTVTTPDGKVAGSNRIESIMGGCALRENWTGAEGNHGTSLNIYSSRDDLWRQTWIDEQGTFLQIQGGLRAGSMVMEGEMTGRNGKPVRHRIAWTPNEDGTVTQLWSVSTDGGGTWKAVFNGIYTRSK